MKDRGNKAWTLDFPDNSLWTMAEIISPKAYAVGKTEEAT